LANATLVGTEVGIGLASVKMAAALLLVLGLLFLGLALLKRFGFPGRLQGRGKNMVTIIDRIVLGPRKQLVVVRFLNKYLVLGVTDANINLIAEHQVEHEHLADFQSILEGASDAESVDSGASADTQSTPGG